MEKLTVVCMLAVLASSTLALPNNAHAFQVQPQDQPRRAVNDVGQNSFGNRSVGLREVQDDNRRTFKDVQARLTALRAQLAAGWQALGMPKEAAEQVAATYQSNGRLPTHHVSVDDKSDAEIASMLQSALAKKDYNLANQTLLGFQRKKFKEQGHVAAEDKH